MIHPLRGKKVQHPAPQHPGMNGSGLSFHAVAFADAADKCRQQLPVIVGFGNPMTSSHIQPRNLRAAQKMAEVAFHRIHRYRQVIRSLFA